MAAGAVLEYDPFEPSIATDPYPVYDWLRDEAPCHFAPATGTYVVSRYDDVAAALGDTDRFSSDAMRGVLLGQPTGSGKERLPRELATGNVVTVDPPHHGELRRIVNRGFTPRRINGWHERIDELVEQLVGRVEPGEEFDVVSGLAAPLPVRIIAELLGADAAQADQVREWADQLTSMMSGSARFGGVTADTLNALMSLAMYLGERIQERERQPEDDLLSTLVRASGEEVLTREEAIGFAGLLLFAGTETTTNLITNASWALLTHADQLELVLDDPSLLPAVLEETLRWESPVQYVFRRATEPFELHGVEVPVDATVTLLLGAANRDPRHWGDTADLFRPDRSSGAHVSFGFGPHFCLGAALARAEAASALSRILPLLAAARSFDGADDYLDSTQFRGRRRLVLNREEV